jgi:hypothetical protein
MDVSRQLQLHSPRGHLAAISKALRRFARYGEVAKLRDYVRSDAFLEAFSGLEPRRRHTAMLVYVEAVAECEARARLPLAVPVALYARTSVTLADWRDPAMQAKLADAYAQPRFTRGRHGSSG